MELSNIQKSKSTRKSGFRSTCSRTESQGANFAAAWKVSPAIKITFFRKQFRFRFSKSFRRSFEKLNLIISLIWVGICSIRDRDKSWSTKLNGLYSFAGVAKSKRGSVSCRWRYWSGMIACSAFHDSYKVLSIKTSHSSSRITAAM